MTTVLYDLPARIRDHASGNAARLAVARLGDSITYGSLVGLMDRIGGYLLDRGVDRGAKAFLNCTNPDLRLAFNLACMQAGIVPIIVLDPAHLRGAVEPDIVVGTAEPFDGTLKSDLVLDQPVLEGIPSGSHPGFTAPDENQLMWIFSTTGTTGQRKIVADTWGAYFRRNNDAVRRFGQDERLMYTMGDITAYGLWSAFFILWSGAALVRHPTEPLDCLRAINLFGVTRISMVPKLAESITAAMTRLGIRCPSLRTVEVTGSLVRGELIASMESVFDADICVSYGTSEAGGISRGVVTAATFEPGYVGDILPGVRIVTDGTEDAPAPLNVLRLGQVFTASFANGRMVPNRETFFGIPDLGFVRGASIYLRGRSDEVFNFTGVKISFDVIEDHLRNVEGVEDVGIASLGPLGLNDDLAIAVVARSGLAPEQLAKDVAARLGRPAVAAHLHIYVCDAIIRNEMGKVDRPAVIDGYRSRRRNPPAAAR